MNKEKKLTRNVLILVLYFVIARFFSGYYISAENCDLHTMRKFYALDDIYLMDVTHNNQTMKLYFDEINKTVSWIGHEKIASFYRSNSYYEEGYISYSNNRIALFRFGHSEMGGEFVLIYRNDPTISKIEVFYDDGERVLLDDWKGNICIGRVGEEISFSGRYIPYDAEGNVLEDIIKVGE